MNKKTCSKCRVNKPTEDFHKNKRAKDGLQTVCKPCKKLYSTSEKRKAYWHKNRDSLLEKKAKYKSTRRREIYEKSAFYIKERRRKDPVFRARHNLARRISCAVKGFDKSKTTIQLLGCSIEQLKEHLSSMFNRFMTWENYGTYWHIDHKRPCSSFDLSDPRQQATCFHYTNLQPLEAMENLRKGNR